MADKKIKVDVEIDSNLDGSIAQLKELKKQLRETAAGTPEFKKLYNQIDDLEDKIKGAKQGSSDWIDTLESAGGPIGMLGGALNKAKVATVSFGTALKATGIGLIVAAVGGLVAAFTETEGAMKKLEPLTIALEQILGGIFTALEPLIDGFVDLAMNVMPYVTKGIGIFYSSLVALFTYIKEAGTGIFKIWKGIFTLDYKSIEEGVSGLAGSFKATANAFSDTMDRFEAGTKKQTKTQKANAKEQKDIADKALQEKLKRMETEDKLDEAKLNKMKAEAMVLAKTEQEKLTVEETFAKKSYELRKKDLEDKQKLYAKNSNEYKAIQAELITLETEYITKQNENATKRVELNKKETEDAKKAYEEQLKALEAFNSKKRDTEIAAIKDEADRAVAARNKKYQEDVAAFENDINFLKLSEEERATILKNLRTTLEADLAKIRTDARTKELDEQRKKYDEDLKLLNIIGEGLMQGTKAYYDNRQQVLDAAMAKELVGVEAGSAEEYRIRQKYQKLNEQLDQEKIASYGKVASAVLDSIASLGSALASSYDEEAKTSEAAFNKRKSLQKATALMSAASGIIQILTQPSVLPSPADWIVKGINAAALAVATAVNIKKIDQTKFEGGGQTAGAPTGTLQLPTGTINVTARRANGGYIYGAGTDRSDSIPAMLSNGEFVVNSNSARMFGPLLSTINSVGNQPQFAVGGLMDSVGSSSAGGSFEKLASVLSTSMDARPIKTYVTATDMSNQQQLQRVQKVRSLI